MIYYKGNKSRILHIPRHDMPGALCNPRLVHYEEVDIEPKIASINVCIECTRRTKFYNRRPRNEPVEAKDY